MYYLLYELSDFLLRFKLTGVLAIWLFLLNNCYSSEFPPIITYKTSDYHAGNQNWKISQDTNNYLYFANNEGLLEFNGSDWTLYPSPNETIIRSVKVIDNKIFTGCYMEFGFWERQVTGQLKYISISNKLKNRILSDEHFWEIIAYDEWVLFQSLNRIYLYNRHSGIVKIIEPENGVWKVFLVNNSIYYQSLQSGLYQIQNGNSVMINNENAIKKNKICHIYQKDSDLFIQTEKDGLLILNNEKLKKYRYKNSDIFDQNDIIRCLTLSDGSIVLGTISNGIYILSNEFDLKYHISQEKGLSNNTVLSLFEDNDKNLWVGLDNGINCLNLDSPFECYVDKSGRLGTVYASKLFQGILYLGTNQGLFFKKFNSHNEFQLIKGTKGQVWTLFEHEGALFCGHNKGTLIINASNATNIYSNSGTWKFNVAPGERDLIFQGNFNGISVLRKVAGQWIFSHKVENYNISSRYFEIEPDLDVFVHHEYKGIFRFKLDKEYKKASQLYLYKTPEKGKNAGLIKFNNNIIYASKQGFYILDKKSKEFFKDHLMNLNFDENNYISGKMEVDKNNRLWYFSKYGLNYFYFNDIDTLMKKGFLFISSSLVKSISGFENIQLLNGFQYLIGTTDGFFEIDQTKLKYLKRNVLINKISIVNSASNIKPIELNKEIVLDYNLNNVDISFSIPCFNKYIPSDYQYILEGYSQGWSNWQSQSTAFFRKLPPGNYTFRLKARNGDDSTISTATIEFKIKKPFYATKVAILIYSIIFMILLYMLNNYYSSYFKKQRNKLIAEHNLKMEIQQLENVQELMKVKNLELTHNVDEKNKELAVSNLDLIRKNELLKLIKDDIKKNKENVNLHKFRSLLSEINETNSVRDSWDIFRKSFDSIDNDFLKRLHIAHPKLSPSELKLCAYLRLSLSSKEIAPILNISIRSVEIKRYRLRKKLLLNHDEGLVNYILHF
jgi:AraC family transcriptional regulator, chitin signaling transcriptional activator